MTRLFLSHSSTDDELASAAALYLRESGVDPVQASHAIRSAEDWSERIRGDLRSCDAALFLVTPHYIERPAWLYMEWAAAWVQGKPPHLLLIDVDNSELPEVMRETQITVFDGKTETLARNLLSVITSLTAKDAKCITLAGRLVDLISTERAKWVEAKWARIITAISNGVATLPDSDLDWIVASARVSDLVTRVREEFAHPALVQKIARYLIRRGNAPQAATLASLLPGHTQLSLFQDVLRLDPDVARTIASDISIREIRRDCAIVAAEQRFPEISEFIGDMTEYAYDRRIIAERLLESGFREHALRVIEKADKSYEKTAFAMTCIGRGVPDLALEVASTVSLNKELRRIGERLIDGGHDTQLQTLVTYMDKNYEKRLLALYAVERGASEAARAIARTMTVSSELVEVAKGVYDAAQTGKLDSSWTDLALGLLFLMKQNEERRRFVEYVMERDREAAMLFARQALQTSIERRRLAEILSEAGFEQGAIDVADLIEKDEEREQLFWFALAKQDVSLADAVVASLSDDRLRARCKAVQAAAAAEYGG